ncbi:inorganic pyrophosphatase [Patescibacteria group bacterium]|nr:inorganic pyrophosphatase [Patescibacteria group bacterium]
MRSKQSLELAQKFLRKVVKVMIDRPMGRKHPKWGFAYEVNYGFVEGIKAPDGGDLDAYVLKIDRPVDEFTGRVVAIIHRLEDNDDKLVVVPDGDQVTKEYIEKKVEFQEKWFKHQIMTH